MYIIFNVEKNNAKIGKYLANIIEQKFKSKREFCRKYIRATGEEPTNETINNMSNRLSQITKGNNDIEMLNKLRAREIPQLYLISHFTSSHLDFNNCYNARMMKHIADSNEFVLNYFTNSFLIRDYVRYKDDSNCAHTFMFPYISKLLDQLIITNSSFAETAIKKALKYNEKTYKKLCELILSVKNDEFYSADCTNDIFIKVCNEHIEFHEKVNVVRFRIVPLSKNHTDGLITNVPHVTVKPIFPILKDLVDELNESYNKIVNIKEHLEEI